MYAACHSKHSFFSVNNIQTSKQTKKIIDTDNKGVFFLETNPNRSSKLLFTLKFSHVLRIIPPQLEDKQPPP